MGKVTRPSRTGNSVRLSMESYTATLASAATDTDTGRVPRMVQSAWTRAPVL